MAISLTVNGKKRQLDEETDLPSFLQTLEVDPRMVAVAYNGDVIPREQYGGVRLRDGDTLEVVRMVGGG
jgi:sulfur carrier protein